MHEVQDRVHPGKSRFSLVLRPPNLYGGEGPQMPEMQEHQYQDDRIEEMSK
jgi:hypothetical protein